MIFIRYGILIFLGLCCGFVVSGGVFAFMTMLGIVPRVAARTGTAKRLTTYENAIILGATLGNIWIVFEHPLPVGRLFFVFFGLFAGIFIGCLAMALAETLRVIPIMMNRLQLKEGLTFIITAMALGKFAGILFQFLIFSP